MIKNEKEYQEAIEKLWGLWDKEGSRDELANLAKAVHEYEEENFPM